MPEKAWVETIPYPKGLLKLLFKTPILLYRLGLGVLVGRLFMVLTTVGRKSGQPRRTAIEFHEFEGKPTVMSGWGERTDWYRNLQANPLATVQTWRGAQSVRARRIDSEEEQTLLLILFGQLVLDVNYFREPLGVLLVAAAFSL